MKNKSTLAVSILAISVLAACGGGGGGHHDEITYTDEYESLTALVADCSGANCGSPKNAVYAGVGVGLWRYTNTTKDEVRVPVYLTNLKKNQPVTLVLTNQRPTSTILPKDLVLSDPYDYPIQSSVRQSETADAPAGLQNGDTAQHHNQIPSIVRNFDPAPVLKEAGKQGKIVPNFAQSPSLAYVVGHVRDWIVSDANDNLSTRTAVLARQDRAADGRIVNFWVENTEYGPGRITDSIINQYATRFTLQPGSIYSIATQIAGQPWGNHRYSDLIDASQPLDIVFVNFDGNSKPYGLMGYFWAVNNFVKSADPTSQYANSNESLSIYIDTETAYLGGTLGMNEQLSTLAHEFTHATNFYRRVVRKDAAMDSEANSYDYQTFLEEMTAVMMEDVVSVTAVPGYNATINGYYPNWMENMYYNCNLADWRMSNDCFSYDVVGSFGSFLLRQLGIDFYQDLLNDFTSVESIAVLDHAIAHAGGTDLATALQRWGSTIALLPSTSPAGFAYPKRANDRGLTLQHIDGSWYTHLRRFPRYVPVNLEGFAHFPYQRFADVNGVYAETIAVPANSSVSMVVLPQ